MKLKAEAIDPTWYGRKATFPPLTKEWLKSAMVPPGACPHCKRPLTTSALTEGHGYLRRLSPINLIVGGVVLFGSGAMAYVALFT